MLINVQYCTVQYSKVLFSGPQDHFKDNKTLMHYDTHLLHTIYPNGNAGMTSY